MKNGKCLKLKEKILLKEQGYNPKDYLRVKKTAEFFEFVQRSTGKILTLRR